MTKTYKSIQCSALKDVAEFMCLAARTAPKTRGRDNLIIALLEPEDKEKVIAKMLEIARRDGRKSFERDAGNLKDAEQIVMIASRKNAIGLDCGFCGHPTCSSLEASGGVCAYNSMDLGIALGSASALAADFRADNRLMFSIGKAAIELGLLGSDAFLAIGVPLSGTGKNPFFDR
ncbi:MAG: DUF2148 domain-containing protein [Candidatus Omnitrophica bacterium]|nr:DUF2148 domain-containing protein [Candidatus Omnitrophota bacterium]MDD4012588.1 DUF2148 domain-containing protein [Candidatus Omnitrophota bacterium]